MRVVTSQEMRAIDRAAIEGLGIPGVVLMENAGRGVFLYLEEYMDGVQDLRILSGSSDGSWVRESRTWSSPFTSIALRRKPSRIGHPRNRST